MELKDGLVLKLGNTQVKIVEKLGDRAKFNSVTNIEVRLAEIPQTDPQSQEYLDKCVLWAETYYQKVDAAKKSGEKVNPRQIKKDAFAELFGAVEAAKPVSRPVRVVKAEPKQVSAPVTTTTVKLDPAELSKKFDTFKADDLPDTKETSEDEGLPPLLDGEDDLLGQAHVAGEEVLAQLGGASADIASLGSGDDIFSD